MDDVQEAVQLEANLNALPDNPTEEQIVQATKGFRGYSVSIAMYKLLQAAGGGGGSGGGVSWVGPFTYRAIDTIYVSITADSGTFALIVNGETTAAIAFDADLAAMLAAIVALPGVTAQDVEIDPAFGNIAFAPGFLSTAVTGDASGLTGVGAAVNISLVGRVLPLVDMDEGQLLDNAVCFRVAEFDDTGPAGAWLTTAADGTPSGSQWQSISPWSLADESQTADLYDPSGDESNLRAGLREVQYSTADSPDSWHVPLPAIALTASTVYLVLDNFNADGTQGEMSVYLQMATPQAPA